MNMIETHSSVALSYSPSSSFSSSVLGEQAPVKHATTMNDLSTVLTSEKKNVYGSLGEQARTEQIEKALKAVRGPEKTWEFSIHKDLNEIMVKVIDRETKEVIREVPPEKLLDMIAGMLKTAGLLIDKKW